MPKATIHTTRTATSMVAWVAMVWATSTSSKIMSPRLCITRVRTLLQIPWWIMIKATTWVATGPEEIAVIFTSSINTSKTTEVMRSFLRKCQLLELVRTTSPWVWKMSTWWEDSTTCSSHHRVMWAVAPPHKNNSVSILRWRRAK